MNHDALIHFLMATSLKHKEFLSRLKPLFTSQRFHHTLSNDNFQQGIFKKSNWKTMDSRSLGIKQSMISSPAFNVLKVLRSEGHETYLVGGCVRDLLLKKTPKDFDVITTAALKEVRRQFNRAQIVGKRFPICMVHLKGCVIEVSSFQTVAKCDSKRKKILVSQIPKGCDNSELARWRNSMYRDFTINSLFFDPFVHKIYDYANGMKDILDLKLRTLLPAQLSFTEDSARILRGLRIAARLGLSLTYETETAIYKHASSVSNLDKSRILMELNYMLSYGAAEPSICLLQRYHILDLVLPFHAAYLSQQATARGPIMLMVDIPDWIGLLAFHLALVNNPQHPHVVATFASVLYHRNWKKGIEFARTYSDAPVIFVPETWNCIINSDDELAKRVKKFSLLVQDSVDALTEKKSLSEAMFTFPDFPCSGLVFVSPNKRKSVRHLFHVQDLNNRERKNLNVDFVLLRNGDLKEASFALGKIILDTMSNGVCQGNHSKGKDNDKKRTLQLPDSKLQQQSAKKQKLIGKTGNFSEDGVIKRKCKETMGADRSLTENEVLYNAYDSKSHDSVTTKKDKVATSLIEKKKCQKDSKKHNEKASRANKCISHENASKENYGETVAVERKLYDKEVSTKQDKKVTSLIDKKECEKVVKKCNEVANKGYKSMSNANTSKEQGDVTTSRSPQKSTINLLNVFENNLHAEETESSKEKPAEIKGHFCPNNVATQNQQISPLQGNVSRKSNPSKLTKKAKEKYHQEKDARPSLSSLFK